MRSGGQHDWTATVGEATTSVGRMRWFPDPTDPLPHDTDHVVLGDLTPDVIDGIVAAVGPGSG